VIELVGLVQVPVAHDEVTPVALDAVVERRCGEPPPVVNVVDVIVTFQPEPDPVASRTLIGSVYVGAWSTPFSVDDTLGVALVESERVPALTVAVAVTLAADALAAAASASPATAVAMHALRAWVRKCFSLVWERSRRVSERRLPVCCEN
jgi:hypothetical protein